MKRAFLMLALIVLAQPVVGADETAGTAVAPLFTNPEPLRVRIEAPLTALMRDRSDTEYLDGSFTYTDAAGADRVLDLKLRARGRYRRQKSTCTFPPVRLNFQKKQVEGTEFHGQDKLKLVTHCDHRRDYYEQYVLKEYLIYKMFNAMTEHSFGARLLIIDYVDTDRGGETLTRYGFVIEDDDLLAERIGGQRVRGRSVEYGQLDPAQASLVAVFNYLVGNTDYSMILGAKDDDCCHNVIPYTGSPGGYLAIPYDFDFAGFVNARYASPNPALKIRSVTRRVYRGSCLHNAMLQQTLERFRQKEPIFREMVASQEGLDDRTRERAANYIDSFYQDIADAKTIERNLTEKCLSSD